MRNPIQRTFTPSISSAFAKGFTLAELLIAAFLTMAVVSVGGWAVATMTASSKNGAFQNERHGELNRALDFISAEIRQAAKIEGDSAALPPEFNAPTNSEADTIQPVLTLTIQNLTHPIIYYIASPKPSTKTWLGPKVIYRWGPAFEANGTYINTTWTHQPLIDSIENTTSTATCDAGWTESPKDNQTGFYACIDPFNRIANLVQVGKLNRVLGPSEPYVASAQTFARASGYTPNDYVGGDDNSHIGVTNPRPGPVTVNYQLLGSDLRCGWAGKPVLVRAIIRMTQPDGTVSQKPIFINPAAPSPSPIVFSNQPPGTTIDYTGVVLPKEPLKVDDLPYLLADDPENLENKCHLEAPSGSRGFNSATNSKQVIVLHDGASPPAYAAFGTGSREVQDYLADYIDADGKIKLPDPQKQVIVLFELWSTNTSESAFDMQDLVLLATFNPA